MTRMLIRFLDLFFTVWQHEAWAGKKKTLLRIIRDYEKSFWEAFNAVTSTNDIRIFKPVPVKMHGKMQFCFEKLWQ